MSQNKGMETQKNGQSELNLNWISDWLVQSEGSIFHVPEKLPDFKVTFLIIEHVVRERGIAEETCWEKLPSK